MSAKDFDVEVKEKEGNNLENQNVKIALAKTI